MYILRVLVKIYETKYSLVLYACEQSDIPYVCVHIYNVDKNYISYIEFLIISKVCMNLCESQ